MFRILKKSTKSKARLGVVQTAHGKIQTPFFMPDATRAAVKGLSSDDLRALGLEAAVINTYHLLLQPGTDIVKKAGGAHKFMNWSGPLCSDSGGYQVYSLIHKNNTLQNNTLRHTEPSRSAQGMLVSASNNRSRPDGHRVGMTINKITDDKVVFRSPLDGSLCSLTPEKSIQIQFDLGADMIVCLDDCPPHSLPEAEMEKSVARTIAWAKRCRAEYERLVRFQKIPSFSRRGRGGSADGARGRRQPLIFAVIQGGTTLSLRRKCAEALFDIGFDGYGLGARPVDGDGKFLSKIVSGVADLIPEGKLRFALGTGTPTDIVKSVKAGWDIFDCVIPTREARHGRLYGWRSSNRHSDPERSEGEESHRISTRSFATLRMTSSRFARDFSPINPNSRLLELRQNSRAYLRHLFKTGEPQAGRLATLNNLEFYLDLMKALRVAIRRGLL